MMKQQFRAWYLGAVTRFGLSAAHTLLQRMIACYYILHSVLSTTMCCLTSHSKAKWKELCGNEHYDKEKLAYQLGENMVDGKIERKAHSRFQHVSYCVIVHWQQIMSWYRGSRSSLYNGCTESECKSYQPYYQLWTDKFNRRPLLDIQMLHNFDVECKLYYHFGRLNRCNTIQDKGTNIGRAGCR